MRGRWMFLSLLPFLWHSPLTLAAMVGEIAPAFSLPSLHGEAIALGRFEGKITLVNFWASWCVPCRDELPALQTLYEKYRDQDFEIIGINIDKQKRNAQTSVERYGLSYTILLDPDSTIIRRYKGQSMPSSYLMDGQGVIREVFRGFSRQKFSKMDTAIKQLLNVPTQ